MDARITKVEFAPLLPGMPRSADFTQAEALRLAAMRQRDAMIAAWLRGAARRLATALGSLAEALATWPLRRRTYEDLRSLSDRELADIGLTRGEIARVFEPDFRRPAAPARKPVANDRAAAAPRQPLPKAA